jgi:signal transduction histidine kinase
MRMDGSSGMLVSVRTRGAEQLKGSSMTRGWAVVELDGRPESTMTKSSVNAKVAGATARARFPFSRFEATVGAAALVAAAAAVWLTLRADFLAHPGWLAVQKADFILGPVLTGLYWRRQRPQSRYALLLIVAGFLNAPYALQSSAAPWAFSAGVIWEAVIYMTTLVLILAFPTGRLDGLVVRLLLAAGIAGSVFTVVIVMVAPVIGPDGSISGCLGACPENGLFVSANVALATRLNDVNRAIIVVNALATIALLGYRFATGTPPRRRALAIGAPIAVFFLLTQAAYQGSRLVGLDAGAFYTTAQWAIAAGRASVWYGFLLALVAAELFAGRVLRRIVEESLRRPTLGELETMLREPLGDPELRLAFWDSGTWVGESGDVVTAGADRVLTTVERDGRPAVAVVHDPELAEDPELVHAAGAMALLAWENAQLEAGWEDALRELSASRARIAAVADGERRAIERDLHDGVQQQLTAALMRLAFVRDLLPGTSGAEAQIAKLQSDLEATLEELRRLAHGIFPAPLAELGLVGALEAVARRSTGPIEVQGDSVARYPLPIESAVYFCCLEAVQNATKHTGPDAHISISLQVNGPVLRFEVRDDGPGFDPDAPHDGVGLRNIRDRVDAFDGRLEIVSAPGRGTVIAGALPIVGQPRQVSD